VTASAQTPTFAAALRAINELKKDGVVEEYAVAGAMAMVFWAEPVVTFDLDVLIFLPEENRPIVTLAPIYEWAARRGYASEAEHVLVEGVPVQFLPSHDQLADEAIETARTLDYEGVPVRVVRPEYLVALYLEPSARTARRRERAAALVESGTLDRELLKNLLSRFNLKL
jgi:hypothetical protein